MEESFARGTGGFKVPFKTAGKVPLSRKILPEKLIHEMTTTASSNRLYSRNLGYPFKTRTIARSTPIAEDLTTKSSYR